MNRKRYSSLLFGLLALSLILFGIPLKVSAYHSGSGSDLAASPELITFRNYGASSVDKLALNPELALIRIYRVSDSGVLKVDSVRWSALGFYYAKGLARLRGAEADSARFAAVGDYYTGLIARGLGVDSARLAAIGDSYAALIARGLDVSSDRWAAMGGYYTGLTPAREAALVRRAALVDPGLTPDRAAALVSQAALADLRPLPPDSVRRSALGLYYAQSMAMLRGAEADSARWVAMGDKLMARGRDTDSARWVAIGTFYSLEMVLAPQPEFNPYQYALGLYDAYLASNPELLSLQRYETCGC